MDYTSMTDEQLTEALHKAVADNNAALTAECAEHSRTIEAHIAYELLSRGRHAPRRTRRRRQRMRMRPAQSNP